MTYNSEAIVLSSKAWPRQARLYILYTRRFGKVKAVVRGAQKVTSKIAGHLVPYGVSEVMFAKGKSIDTLAQARLEKVFPSLQMDWTIFVTGMYMLELVDRFTEEGVADEVIWDLLLDSFSEIDKEASWFGGSGYDKYQLMLISRKFAVKYLSHMGYKPELYECLDCRKNLVPKELAYSMLQGGCLCGNCKLKYPDADDISADVVKHLRFLINQEQDDQAIHVDNALSHQTINMIDKIVSVLIHKPLNTSTINVAR